MDILLPLLTGVAGLLLGLLAAGARGSRVRAELAAALARAERLQEESATLRDQATRDNDVLRALVPVQAGLSRMDEQVALLERERIEQFSALSEQLNAARAGHEELRRTTASLASALRSSSARGQWGEVELQRVLEAAGMLRHVDFTAQRAISERARPDVVVHLPGGRTIPIDAKVPFDAYLKACGIEQTDAESAARRADLLATHARTLRGHVDELARRGYHDQMDGADLTVLFLPSEGLLAAALDADPGLLEHALRRGISLASPATLLALMRAVAAVWAHQEVTEQARELLRLGRTLYERLGVVAGHLGTLGRSLRSSVTAYNKAVASMETRLLVTAREFEALGAEVPTVAEIDGDAGQVREFTASALGS